MAFWGLAGFGLGWWLAVLIPRRSRAPGAPSVDAPELVWTLWIAAAFAVLLLAFAEYFGWFGSAVYAIEGFLLSRSVFWLTVGSLLGYGLSRHRDLVGRRAAQFYLTLLGRGGGKSAWALQSAVAILSLFLIVVALSPDILEHLESIKAGEVEAKFASVSTTTREAHQLTLGRVSNDITIAQWIGFIKNYRDDSPRNNAMLLFDHSSIKSERTRIGDLLFDNYIEPFATLLACLETNDLLQVETRGDSFVKLSLNLRNAIVDEMQPKSRVDKKRLRGLLLMIDQELVKMDQILEMIPESVQEEKCDFKPRGGMSITFIRDKIHRGGVPNDTNNREDSNKDSTKALPGALIEVSEERSVVDARNKKLEEDADRHAQKLFDLLAQATKALDKNEDERQYTLSVIDPYVTSAVADLLNLGLGPAAKADFLTVIKSKYPIEMNLFQPGLVNIYYQLGDVKNKTEVPWPFEERIEDLHQAMKGVEYVIAETRRSARAAERNGSHSITKEVTKEGLDVQTAERTQGKCHLAGDAAQPMALECYAQIVEVYFTVKFYVLTRFVETYYLRSLAGDPLSAVDKLHWMDFYRQLEAVLNNNQAALRLTTPTEGYPVPTEDVPYWQSAIDNIKKGNASQLFDAGIGMALSSIMLTENGSHKATAQACALARHYLSEAKGWIRLIDGLDDAERDHLSGHVLQAEARVAVSC